MIRNTSYVTVHTERRSQVPGFSGVMVATVQRCPTGLCLLTTSGGRRSPHQSWHRTEQAALTAIARLGFPAP